MVRKGLSLVSQTKTFYFDFHKIKPTEDSNFIDKKINCFLLENKVVIEGINYDLGEGYLFVSLEYFIKRIVK